MEGSEAAVLAQARGGDHEAFRALVERYSRQVFRLAHRITGNEHDAEEVVQEAFLRAYRAMPRFESRATFGTWIYRIAANCALDMMRMRQREEEVRQPLATREDEPGSGILERVAAGTPAPDRLLLSAEVQERVGWAMARLTPMERAAFTLRHFEDLSIEEIASSLGLRNGAAKNNIFRAVRKLRQALEPLVGTTGSR